MNIKYSIALTLVMALLSGCESSDSGPEVKIIQWDAMDSMANFPLLQLTSGDRRFETEATRFSYRSGASNVANYRNELDAVRQTVIPERAIAEAVNGEVKVRIRGSVSLESSSFRQQAQFIATAMHRVTTEVWPGETVPIVADIFVLNDDARISHGIEVDWRQGDAFQLAVFFTDSVNDSTMVIHELFHVLSGRWGIGQYSREGASRPHMSTAFDEMSANSYAECGKLLAAGELKRPQLSGGSVIINGRTISRPATTADLGFLLEALDQVDATDYRGQAGATIGLPMLFAPLNRIFEEEELTTLESQKGQEILSLCRTLVPDHSAFSAWMYDWVTDVTQGSPVDFLPL